MGDLERGRGEMTTEGDEGTCAEKPGGPELVKMPPNLRDTRGPGLRVLSFGFADLGAASQEASLCVCRRAGFWPGSARA